MRNPLGGLELYAGLLRDALGGEPERLQEVARIEREIGYLKTVVNEFLDYARRPPLELGDVAAAPAARGGARAGQRRRATGAPAIVVDAPGGRT